MESTLPRYPTGTTVVGSSPWEIHGQQRSLRQRPSPSTITGKEKRKMSDQFYQGLGLRRPADPVKQRSQADIAYSVGAFGNTQLHLSSETLASALMMQHAALKHRAVELVEAPCRQHGIALEALGIYPLFPDLKLVPGTVTDMVIVPAEQDPLITTGKFPLPKAVRDKLGALQRAGVPFELLHTYIAHEVPANSVSPYGPIPLEAVLPPPSARVTRTSEMLGSIAHAATISFLRGTLLTASAAARGASSIAKDTGSVAGAAPLTMGAAAMSFGSRTGAAAANLGSRALMMLDPVIFCALPDEHGIAVWYAVASWVW
jgi:hypothetical protein